MNVHRHTFEGVIFDKDGVLADSEWINLRSTFEVFAARGFRLEKAAADEIVGRHPIDHIPVLACRLGICADEQMEMLRERTRLYDELWDQEGRLFPDARDTLASVRGLGMRTGIATSSTRSELELFLMRFELVSYFDVALSRDDVAHPKPQPEVYQLAARRLDVAPNNIVVVEDSGPGIRAAIAAGTFCVATRTKLVSDSQVLAANAQITSLSELPPLIARLKRAG